MSETKKYLLVLSIGPVQGFIAAARKTRDLWFGSHLLSEISKATAMAVEKCGGKLIFPGDANLEDKNVSVANVVLAEVESDPKSVADRAKKAAETCWKKFAEDAKQKVLDLANSKNVLREKHWDNQINDFLELHAAWVPFQEDYKNNRDRVMRLLAGRKACRDFLPATGEHGLPKSSLDGARETVLEKELPATFRQNLHIRDGEQLDAIGVVKRFANRKSFKSLAHIAIDPLVRNNPGVMEEIEQNDEIDDNKRLQKLAEKSPYFAIICADGDKMGAAISAQTSSDDHQKLSTALSGFAKNVPNTVKRHHGECVYAGGDDVLAFVPLDQAISCARKLHDDFATNLVAYKDQNVSLSVGIVVGHHHEMLETLLDFARKAESAAKKTNEGKENNDPQYGDRNGLAVWTYHRSNSLCGVRERWQGDKCSEKSLDNRLLAWADLFEKEKIPMKFPYDLRDFAKRFVKAEIPIPSDFISSNALQIMKQKRFECDKLSNRLKTIDDVQSLLSFADELMIAQMIGDAIKLAKER